MADQTTPFLSRKERCNQTMVCLDCGEVSVDPNLGFEFCDEESIYSVTQLRGIVNAATAKGGAR